MIQEYITKFEQTIQCIVLYIINLCFQPVYCLLSIIQNVVEIWDTENTIDPEDETVYPEPAHISGFHSNANEQAEIEKIKEQLNQK